MLACIAMNNNKTILAIMEDNIHCSSLASKLTSSHDILVFVSTVEDSIAVTVPL